MDTSTNPLSPPSPRVALVTGGSAGLGLALTTALAVRGWTVVTDARDRGRLHRATGALSGVVAIPGDVTDPRHREDLVAAARRAGPIDLLVHNASTLGPLPLHLLSDLSLDDLRRIWETNAGAPAELTRMVADDLRAASGVVITISSDAAIDRYPTWGGYGAAKIAAEHLTLTFAVEQPDDRVRAYVLDPGDMRTAMHADAFPGQDISDRPLPETVVPRLLALVVGRPPSGRYRAAELAPVAAGGTPDGGRR